MRMKSCSRPATAAPTRDRMKAGTLSGPVHRAASGGGNAFIVDAPARDWTEAARRASLVTVQRLSVSALQVRYDRRLQVFRQEATVNGMTVTYLPIKRSLERSHPPFSHWVLLVRSRAMHQ